MYQKTLSRIAAIFFAFVLAACATSGGQSGDTEIRSGVIEQITPVQLTSNHGLGVGAVVGAHGRVGHRPRRGTPRAVRLDHPRDRRLHRQRCVGDQTL